MSYKLNGFMFTAMFAAVGMLAVAGTTFAQTIPGTFVGINDTNTETQEDRGTVGTTTTTFIGTRFSSTLSGGSEFPPTAGFVGFWEERTVELSVNNGPIFNSLGYTGVSGDPAIVTTLEGLQQGTYDVELIYVAVTGQGTLPYATGFSATSTSQVLPAQPTGGATLFSGVDLFFGNADGTPLPGAQTSFSVFGSPIGNATVGADGQLQVFTEDLGFPTNTNFSAIAGLSLVQTSAVPEPSSLALLGLFGGLGLIRRRR